eukprot:7269079-Ditylum_brightwellii.AAC.1
MLGVCQKWLPSTEQDSLGRMGKILTSRKIAHKSWSPEYLNYLCLTLACECSSPTIVLGAQEISTNKKLLTNPEHGA